MSGPRIGSRPERFKGAYTKRGFICHVCDGFARLGVRVTSADRESHGVIMRFSHRICDRCVRGMIAAVDEARP